VMRDPGTVARVLAPHADSDATAHVWIRGVWPGRYRLSGGAAAEGAATRFVRFKSGKSLVETLELDLLDAAQTDVEAVLVPAAGVTGHLVCGDGHPLPGLVSIAAVTAGFDPVDADPAALVRDATLTLEKVPLRGTLHDEFTAGPLETGAYLVAFRPEGFERWTWAPGGEHPAGAASIGLRTGAPTDLGTIEVDCGPAIELTPRVASGEPLPDLREGTTHEKVALVSGTLVDGERERVVRDAIVDAYRDRVILRGLPPGRGRLDATLRNRFFLPAPQVETALEGEFDRGRLVRGSPAVASIGGALRVSGSTALAVRVLAPDGSARIQALALGRVEVPSLPAGSYRVELCADAACATGAPAPLGVELAPRRITDVTGPP